MISRRLAASDVSGTARAVRRWPMAPTRRAAVLFAFGVAWVVPAWIDPRALLLMAVWNLVIAAVIAIDGWRLPPPAVLRVTRRWAGPLALGSSVGASLELHNGGAIPVRATLTDYLGAALSRDLPVVTLDVAAGRSSTGAYEVTPRERGDEIAGDVVVEWRSAWGLVERWAQAALEQTVRVYPNIHEARRHSLFLIRSSQVALEKRRAKWLGGGREFDRLREYRAGDDRRDVNWRVSARRARLVTRMYQPERSQTVWLLVDAGRLLRARTGAESLLDRATTAALALAQVAMAAGDNVGLVAYGRRIQHRLLPGRGASQLRRLTESLAVVRAEPVEADHGAAAAALRSGQQRRALVVWLTEVAETAAIPDVIEYAMNLVPRHVLVFATMKQPEVAGLAALAPATPSEMYRVVAAQESVDRREALLRSLRQRGALVVEASPQTLAGGLIDRYLEVKGRGMV